MKVPNPVAPSVAPSATGLAYLRPADTGRLESAVQGITHNLRGIGAELGALDERQQQTLAANARLQAYSDLSDLHTGLSQDLNQLKTTTPATENFPGIAAQHISPKIDEFVGKLPAPLQSEFRYRAHEISNSLLTDAHEFQDKQGVAFANIHIEDAGTKAANTLRQNPTKDELKAQQAIVYQSIDAAPVDPAQKVLAKRKADLALSQIVFGDQYNKFYQKQIVDAQAALAAAGKGGSGYEARLVQIESGGRTNAVSPTGAFGPYQFTRGTGERYGITPNSSLAEQKAAFDRLTADNRAVLQQKLGRAPTDGELYLAHQQGANGAVALLSHPNELAVDVVGETAVRVNGGAPGMTAAQFANKWISKFQGGGGTDVATKFEFNPTIENDPAFANIPLEDRLNLQKDAYAQASGAITAQNAGNKQLLDEARNQRYLNAEFSDKYNQTQFDQERMSTHLWDDFKDAEKMQKVLDQKNKKGQDQRIAMDMERTGAPFTNTTEGKRYGDALFTVKGHVTDAQGNDLSGLDRLANGDHEYVANTLIPTVQRINMIPPNVSSILSAYTISADPKRMKFGFDSLMELKQAAPQAFNTFIPEQVRKDTAFYEAHQSTQRYTSEELLNMMRPRADDPNRQYELALREKADKAWGDGTVKPENVIKAATDSSIFRGEFGGSAAFPTPLVREAALSDLKTVFEDEVVRSGDVKTAFGLATEWFNTVWAQNDVGGERYMMKHPPQSVGYQPMGGSMEWMTRQGHDELHIPGDHTFRLLSDQQTEDDYTKWQHDPSAPPASYVVVENTGANGAGQIITELEAQRRMQRLPSEDAIGPLHLTPQEQHLYEHHLNNVKQGKFVRQDNGAVSTILDITGEQDGRYFVIPTVWDGKVVSSNEALQRAAAEGWQNWPHYATETEANNRYEAMHAVMDQDVTESALASAQRTVPFSDPAQSGLAPYRMHFKPSPADIAHDEQYTRWQNAKSKFDYYDQHVYGPALARVGWGNHPLPKDIQDEYNALKEATVTAKPVEPGRAVSQEGIGSAQRFPSMPGAQEDTRAQPLFSPSEQQQLRITP